MILRFGCPRPSAPLIHTHALFTLGASGCHLGHNSHLFHPTARRAAHSRIWTREGTARTASSRHRPAFPRSPHCEKSRKRRCTAVGETSSDKNESNRSGPGFVVIVEKGGWERMKHEDVASETRLQPYPKHLSSNRKQQHTIKPGRPNKHLGREACQSFTVGMRPAR